MKLRVEGTGIYDGDILVARCVTSVSSCHEVTKSDAEALAHKLVANVCSDDAPKKVTTRRKRAAK